MTMDPDDARAISYSYWFDELAAAADRLAVPEIAHARWLDLTTALLLAGAGDRLDVLDVCALAAHVVVVELREAL